MRHPAVLVTILLLSTGCQGLTPEERYREAMSELSSAKGEESRFYALDAAAKTSFEMGRIQEAKDLAKELLALAPKFKRDWNFGNAIQDGNLVLGRIAVKNGQLDLAELFLHEAGDSAGSPQMNSFGPNMSLASDLLAKGRRESVLAYFEQCKKFWEGHEAQLNEWGRVVRSGGSPNFGSNLFY